MSTEPTEITSFDEDVPATPIGDVAREIAQTEKSAPLLATVPVKTDKLDVRVKTLADHINGIGAVATSAAYVALVGDLKLAKATLKEIDATFDPIIEKQRAALDEARGQKKRHADPLLAAERHGKSVLEVFDAEQKRIADEEQKRLEAQQLAEAHDRRLDEAFEAEASGDAALADEILSTPVQTAPIVVTRGTPVVDGVSHKANWKGECSDLAKLVLAAADELRSNDRTKPRVAFSMLEAATVKKAVDSQVNSRAKTMKSELNKVPGCRAWDAGSTSIKA